VAETDFEAIIRTFLSVKAPAWQGAKAQQYRDI
jgi:hypothetical protein